MLKTPEELTEFTRKNWYTLPEKFRQEVVIYLRATYDMDSFKEKMLESPYEWSSEPFWHFGQGMEIRNSLREGGFKDEMLTPIYYNFEEVRNWDDFYTAALEAAAGVIDV